MSVLDADATTLGVRVEAADEENLRKVQDLVAADLERFGRRDQVTVTWRSAAERTGDDRDADQEADAGQERQDRRRDSGQST